MSQEPDESILFFDRRGEPPHLVQLGCGTAALYSDRSPTKTSANEDTLLAAPLQGRSAVLAVADGMGGGAAGEVAAKLAVQSLQNSLRQTEDLDQAEQLRYAILNGIEHANRQILRMGVGAATTIAVAEIHGSVVRPYHVGDSLILVVGNRGKLKLQSVSHSPVGYAVQAGLINEADAMMHEDRHLVSNMLGMEDMTIEIGSPITMAQRDTLLLASDGLTDNLHIHEIVELIRKGGLPDAARRLAERGKERMILPNPGGPSKPDDLTFITFRQ